MSGSGDELHDMLVRDLAVLDPPPPGAKLQGKPVWVLSEHMQKVFRARYDGTAATIQQLAAELGISRVQVIEWATQLGIRNRTQPGTVVRHVFPAYPAIPEDDEAEDEGGDEDGEGEGGEIVDANVIEEVPDETPVTDEAPAAERERRCMRCKQEKPWSAFDGLKAKICTVCREQAEHTPTLTKSVPAPKPEPTAEAETKKPESSFAQLLVRMFTGSSSGETPQLLAMPQIAGGLVSGGPLAPSHEAPTVSPRSIPATPALPTVPPLLLSVLEHLPADREWTSAQRERWLRAFTGALDLLVDLREQHDGQGAA